MGALKFFRIHHPCASVLNSAELYKKCIAVDLSGQIYRICIGNMKNKLLHNFIDSREIDLYDTEYNKKVGHIIALCTFVINYVLRMQFVPIFVLDGKSPEIKSEKIIERRKIREIAKENMDYEEKDSENYNKYSRESFYVTNKDYKQLVELLIAMGLPYIKSYGEADSQCAALSFGMRNAKVDAIMAEDSDVMIFGGENIINNYDKRTNTFLKFNLCDVKKNMQKKINNYRVYNNLENIDEFTDDNFLDITIIFGTDYNEPFECTKYMEQEKVIEIFSICDMNIETFVNYCENKFGCPETVCQKFVERLSQVKTYYKTAYVIDPDQIKLEIKEPDKKRIFELLVDEYKFYAIVCENLYNGLFSMYVKSLTQKNDNEFKFRYFQKKPNIWKKQKYIDPY
jgi:flap endonuclease-1